MASQQRDRFAATDSVRITNPGGAGRFVFTCDHASNFMLPEFGSLGLPEAELSRHIAWDPGALPVARRMAEALDATLIEACLSRLVIDCNRPLDADNLICETSEGTVIPGNSNLTAEQRQARIDLAWTPFHEAIEQVVTDRLGAGHPTCLISVHSFTPVYFGKTRPWHVGIIHDDDTRLAAPMIDGLKAHPNLIVGVNEPYSPVDRVYFTLERHARPRGLPCAMIEIRNDEIADAAGQARWAGLLVETLRAIPAENGVPEAASQR
jgi:predicted N-formylglutamate amidohydrolase